jgi:hypothetical protein
MLYEVRLQLHHAHAALVTANLQADTATGSLDALNRRANVLAIMHELRGAFERRTLGYRRAQQAYVEMRNTAIERQRALQIATQDLGAGYEAIAALYRPTSVRVLKGKKFLLKLPPMSGTCTTIVMKSMTQAMRLESCALMPFATGKAYKRSMPIQNGTLMNREFELWTHHRTWNFKFVTFPLCELHVHTTWVIIACQVLFTSFYISTMATTA